MFTSSLLFVDLIYLIIS